MTAEIDDIVAFDRDILVVAIGIGPTSGKQIQDELGRYYANGVNHSRLYTALGRLADKGLVEKKLNPEDSRANRYTVTDEGREVIAHHRHWEDTHCRGSADVALAAFDAPDEQDTHA